MEEEESKGTEYNENRPCWETNNDERTMKPHKEQYIYIYIYIYIHIYIHIYIYIYMYMNESYLQSMLRSGKPLSQWVALYKYLSTIRLQLNVLCIHGCARIIQRL